MLYFPTLGRLLDLLMRASRKVYLGLGLVGLGFVCNFFSLTMTSGLILYLAGPGTLERALMISSKMVSFFEILGLSFCLSLLTVVSS
jgi:hypothetical protein